MYRFAPMTKRLTNKLHRHTPPLDEDATQLIEALSTLLGADVVRPYHRRLAPVWRYKMLEIVPWLIASGASYTHIMDALSTPFWCESDLAGLRTAMVAWLETHEATRQKDPWWFLHHHMTVEPAWSAFTGVIDILCDAIWQGDEEDVSRDRQRWFVLSLVVRTYADISDALDEAVWLAHMDTGQRQCWQAFETAQQHQALDALAEQWHEAICDLRDRLMPPSVH